jgi:hypothetical protein
MNRAIARRVSAGACSYRPPTSDRSQRLYVADIPPAARLIATLGDAPAPMSKDLSSS